MKLFASLCTMVSAGLLLTSCIHRDPATTMSSANAAPSVAATTPTPASTNDPLVAQLKAVLIAQHIRVESVSSASGSAMSYYARLWLPGCRTYEAYGIDYNGHGHPLIYTSVGPSVKTLTSPPKKDPSRPADYCVGS